MAKTTRFSVAKTQKSYSADGVDIMRSTVKIETEQWATTAYGNSTNTSQLKPTRDIRALRCFNSLLRIRINVNSYHCRTSELDAVNVILASLVTSCNYSEQTSPDVAIACNTLLQVNEVQAGWTFNKEYRVPLTLIARMKLRSQRTCYRLI